MFAGSDLVALLERLSFTDVVWLPDSALGHWEAALEGSTQIALRRVCREGEAWGLAAGLYLGGRQPLVMIQSTGLFESGDGMRNVLFDLKLPLFSIVGYRSYFVENSSDTARHFLEPILNAWKLDYVLLSTEDDLAKLEEHVRRCRTRVGAGVALLAEGAM